MMKFFESVHFEPLKTRQVHRGPVGPNISFSDRYPMVRDRVLGYFDELSSEHVGTLRGEYLLLPNGWTLLDRKGVLVIGCVHYQYPPSGNIVWSELHKPATLEAIDQAFLQWDRYPVIQNAVVLSELYPENYWHFSIETVPRLRHLAAIDHSICLIPETLCERPFQLDLLARTFPGANAIVQREIVRVIDPVLIYDTQSAEGVSWLRQASGLAARPGHRRVQIRRSSRTTRASGRGDISDYGASQALLREFGFETIEFGDGEHDVAAQVAMLDGAGLILSPQGAGMANLAYLDPSVRVIEIMGAGRRTAGIVHLANGVGFDYHGIYSDVIDNHGDIVIDPDELHDTLRARLPARRAAEALG